MEAVYGTPVLPQTFFPFSGNTVETDPGLFFPQVMVGSRDYQVFPLYGQEKNLGALDGPLFPTNGIMLLVAAIGTDAVSGSAAPYTHTVSQAVTIPSLTVEKNLGNYQSLQFAGAMVNKYTLKGQATDTEATFTADMIAQSVAILDSPSAVTLIDEEPFVFAEFDLQWAGGQLSQAGNFTLTIDNMIKPTYTFNGYHQLQFLTPEGLKANGSFDVVYDSLDSGAYDFFTQIETGVDAALSITLTHPSTYGPPGYPSGYSVKISMGNVRLAKEQIPPKFGEVIMETINFEAHRSLSASPSTTLSAVIHNGQATAIAPV